MDLFFKYINKIFIKLILFYQKIISPMLPARCRYYPTCSQYGKQALAWHGTQSGGWLLLKRLARCHPLGGQGIDFVPLPMSSYCYQYLSSSKQSNMSAQGWSVYRDSNSYVARLNHLMR